MPLQKKSMKTSTAQLWAWVCCSPCLLSCGTLCGLTYCLTCACTDKTKCCGELAFSSCCQPCDESKLAKNSGSIAFRVMSYAFELEREKDNGYLKLKAIDSKEWSAASLFSQILIDDAASREVSNQIKKSVYAVLDQYDFGTLRTADLSDDDVNFIGKQLRTAVFCQLPTKDEFFNSARKANIDVKNPIALNGFLLGLVEKIVTRDQFMLNQLGLIGDQLVANKAATVLAKSQDRSTLFNALNAGKAASMNSPREEKMDLGKRI